jgi:hypothetical protein
VWDATAKNLNINQAEAKRWQERHKRIGEVAADESDGILQPQHWPVS